MEVSCELVDDYEHLDVGVEYILENVLSEEVKRNINVCNESKELNECFNTLLLNRCECNGHKQECSKCSHGVNYIFNEQFQELVLADFHNLPDLVYECSNMCKCEREKCQNRLVQYGPRKYLKIVYSQQYFSKGLITLRDIPKGAFICEYAGDLLTTKEAKSILRENEMGHKMNYILFLKESCASQESNSKIFLTIVNPTRKGNIGRYLNHSCEPNCFIISVRIDSPIPKIAFFSKRYIKSGEEISFNYNEGVGSNEIHNMFTSKRIPCLCGTKNCIKYLPNSQYRNGY